jgi:two-component system, sporulation sensor kinase E
MKNFWNRVADRLDRIGPAQVHGYFENLCRETALLSSILESVSDGILVVDHKGRILFLNDAAGETLGISHRSLVSKRLLDHTADPELSRLFEESLRDQKAVIDRDVEARHPKRMILRVNVMPYRVGDSQPPGTIVILRDITAEKHRQAESFQSEKLEALVTLAAGVAHEIGNPLNSLAIHMQLMEREIQHLPKKSRQKLTETLEVAKNEIKRLDDILRRFLGAIRPTQLHYKEVNINNLVESVLDFMYFEISEQDIAIEKEYDSRVPLALMDEDQIKQAFFNIIKNAIQAMPRGGVLRATTSLRDSHVVVTFSDTGVGVPEDKLNRVFEPFYTTKEGGSGLGLMMVYKIVKDHSGTVELTSQKGQGTTVTVSLPIHGKKTRLLRDSSRTNEDGNKRQNPRR